MPNWVSNSVTITGSQEALDRFKAQAEKTPPTWTKTTDTDEDKVPTISFGNFIAPPQESLDSGEYHETHGWSKGEKTGQTENNWYNFNIREWGTKWDACEAYLSEEAGKLNYSFQTAWSPPEPVFSVMAEQYPELDFQIWWEEEQGFGATLASESGNTGNLIVTKEWDIPSSHADYVDKDGDADGCVCSWNDEPEEWYEDCPKPDGVEFEVTLTRTLKVTARDKDHAVELVNEALADVPTIERLALGDKDPYTVTEFEDGVELVVEEVEA